MLWPTRLSRPLVQLPREASGTPRHERRNDIQGLRAIAVLLVVANHLVGHPRGGFVGVDVFFVISGFLITGLLLRERLATGRISIRAFYQRRVKRIVPAAALVVVVTLLASLALLTEAGQASLRQDALWALFSAVNWRMILVGTDYMHANDAVSPLQHFWSLAVEEQFYVLWPMLLIGVVALGRRWLSVRQSALVAVTVMFACSIGFGAVQSAFQPTVAYFSTFSRGWELAAGAVLAILAPRLAGLNQRLRFAMGWAGVFCIVLAALTISGSTMFPVPGAIVPVVGASLLIVAGIGGVVPGMDLLSSRPMVWLGERSYSLYLWHFPVVIYIAVLLPQKGGRYWSLALVLSCLLAMLSYKFVEDPLRRASWKFWRTGRPRSISRSTIVVGIAQCCLLVAVATIAVVGRTPMQVSPIAASDLVEPAAVPAEQLRLRQLQASLTSPTWQRPVAALLSGDDALRAPEWIEDGCLGDDGRALADVVENAKHCVFGSASAPHEAVVLGDSTAISWLPGLRVALGPTWRIEVWTARECAAVDIDVRRSDGIVASDCARLREAALARVRVDRPDLVVLTTSSAAIARLPSELSGSAAYSRWEQAALKTELALASSAGRVVFLDAPPDVRAVRDCATPLSGPNWCVSSPSRAYLDMARAQRAAVKAAGLSNIHYVDDLNWFCVQGRCPPTVDGVMISADGRHLTRAASEALGKLLQRSLLPTGSSTS